MFEAIIRQIFKNHRSHLLLSTLDLVLLKELTSSTSYHTRITARQVMNFIWQNLDSEFLVTDSRLSQPNKELLVTCSNNALTYIWIRNINKTTKCFTAHWHSEEPRACVTSFRTSVRSHANACDNHEIIVRQEDWCGTKSYAKISSLYSLIPTILVFACWYNLFHLCTGFVPKNFGGRV